jgi:SAM-dependent methyltransferase
MLQKFGSVAAVELDSFARDHVRAAMKIEVAPGSLPDELPYADRKFDLICLFDVLEHVERDQEALCILRERLAPKGLLIITVPAYQWLYSSHDVQHHHYRRYTARRLRTMAKAAGLRPTRVGYYNTVLFPLALIRRFAEKLLNLHPIDDSALPGSLLNHFLYRAFSLEARVIRSWFFPVGLSVVGLFHAGEETRQ